MATLSSLIFPGSVVSETGTATLTNKTIGDDLKFADADESNYVALQAASTVASNVTWTLPDADGTNGQVLSTNGSGTLSWASGGGGGSSISAGDSSVAVTDSGTGKVEVTVDNVEVADFTTGAIVFNETGANQDFRVEGDTIPNLLFVNAGEEAVVIGGQTPLGLFNLVGVERPAGPATYTSAEASAKAQAGLNWYQDANANYEYYLDVFATGTSESPWGGSNLRFLTTAVGTATATERARITRAGTLLVGTTSTTANGGVVQVSNGITFPATQSACSDANTLDDYEEGTWTGTLKGATSDPSTPVTATGKYVKTGKQVTLSISFNNVTTTGASGNVFITGVPFNPDVNGFGSILATDFTFSSGHTSVSCFMNTGNNILTIVTCGTGVGFGELQHSAGSGRYLWAGVTYFVA